MNKAELNAWNANIEKQIYDYNVVAEELGENVIVAFLMTSQEKGEFLDGNTGRDSSEENSDQEQNNKE
jgi:hypothetical protein